mgnify:FL=1
MKKVELRTMEQIKYEIIKNLVDNDGNKHRAAIKLGITIRQVNRLIQIYKSYGKAGFVHGNRGRLPKKEISQDIKNKILELYKSKYFDANFKHFQELLEEYEHISVSYTVIYTLLRKANILSPKVQKDTIKQEKKKIRLTKKNKEKLSEGQKDLIVKNNILDKYDAHSRIPRLKYFGECLEMDACEDYWLGIDFGKITLHGAIDNATGTVCGLYFDKHETLNGYYHLFERIWRKYGVPAKFLTDNRTVFIYNGLKQKSMEKDTLTQFGYACHQLGVELVTTSIPEKKSRIERLWETLLSRLTVELRLAGINNIEDANEFLNTYTTKYNKRFALPVNYITSVFEMVDRNLINTTLSIISKRVFDKGCSIKYKNKTYLAYKGKQQINFCRNTRCLVIKTFDGRLLCNVDDELYQLVELEDKQKYSKNFDFEQQEKKKKYTGHIPPMTHPWKMASYQAYLLSNKRTEDYAYN